MGFPALQLAALANETRAAIIQRLERGEFTVGELAEGLPVTRPAVSQHLRVLEDADLVQEEFRGTKHVYRLNPKGLAAIRSWLDQFWSDSLESFAEEVERQNKLESVPRKAKARISRGRPPKT